MRYPALSGSAFSSVVWSCFRRALIWAAEMVQGVLWAGAESALLVLFLFFPFPAPLVGVPAGVCSQKAHMKTHRSAGEMSYEVENGLCQPAADLMQAFPGKRARCPVSCVPPATHKECHMISRALSWCLCLASWCSGNS